MSVKLGGKGIFTAEATPLPALLAPGVWRLGNHHIAMFLVEGSEAAALVEVGIRATVPLALAQIEATRVPREKVRYLVLSHAHSDHATGQAGLAEAFPEARLTLTAKSAEWLDRPATIRVWDPEDEFSGLSIIEREGGPAQETWPGLDPLLPGKSLFVQAGDSLDLGGVSLMFLAGEGHAPGGLAMYVPERGVLLASDSGGYLQGGRPGFPLYFCSYPVYMRELAAMSKLSAEVVAPGHQGWFSGAAGASYLNQTRDRLESTHQQILSRLAAGESQEHISRDLFLRYHTQELSVFPPPVIADCCRLLVKRSAAAG